MINFWASMSGPKALPGNYKVTLDVDGQQVSTSFSIENDPLSEASQEDLEKQFKFVASLRDKLTDIHETIIRIRQIKRRLINLNSN